MTVYVTRKNHYNYNYLMNWRNPESGAVMAQWFHDLKELKEYIKLWNATIEYMN